MRELPDGRYRYYDPIAPPQKSGEMAGRRRLREWDPPTNEKRTWHETVDHDGQVRPEAGGPKVHYTFDGCGNYTGSW
ncbi:hypothetical protein Misp01_74140 [Microtetraspora sp. NBRC 13810]|nr:hypothetical protein Misp01_74140 [Microtetraspora sp. NBRC 13810]